MSKLSLKMKLLLLCAFLSTVSVAIGVTSYFAMDGVDTQYGWIVKKTMPKMQYSDQMYLSYRKVRINLRTLGLPGLSPADVETAVKNAVEGIAEYETEDNTYVAFDFIPGQKELYSKVEAAWQDFKITGNEVLDLQKTGTPAAKERMLQIFVTDCPRKAAIYTKAIMDLAAFHRDTADKKVTAALEISHKANITMISMVVGGTLFGLILGFLFARSLSKSLNRMSEDISGAAEQTSSGGTQLAAASAQLSSGSTEAAASLEETVASLEELASMVRMNTDNAKQANSLSQNSKDAAEKGSSEIEKLVKAMSEIASGSKKIEEIIHVIDDIAFQTNLLALNAAVEAARAGEQGKGFAVVAEAVRSLAQKSAEAAKDINSLIKDNVEKSFHGATIASNSGAVLQDILIAVKKVADLNGEIAAGSQEQTTGLEQISKAMNQLDQATQGNAASSEEVAASSEEMSSQANALADLVSELQLLVHGKGGHAAPPQASLRSGPAKKKSPARLVKKESAKMIPFDEEDGRSERKIGDASGF
jgi:methyl-accepting chemotaxis protein